MTSPVQTPTPAVGVVCLRHDEVLLIRRGEPPRQGEWSLPGGKIDWGERAQDAALRELQEETGVQARLAGLVDVVDGLFSADGEGDISAHYVLIDFVAHWTAGEPVAGDDAIDARFVPLSEIDRYGLWAETTRIITAAARQSPAPSPGPRDDVRR